MVVGMFIGLGLGMTGGVLVRFVQPLQPARNHARCDVTLE